MRSEHKTCIFGYYSRFQRNDHYMGILMILVEHEKPKLVTTVPPKGPEKKMKTPNILAKTQYLQTYQN